MKRTAVVAALFVLALASPGAATDRGVTMPGKLFEPERIELLVGETVTWTNRDSVTHTVTADDGSFDSGDLDSDGTFTLTFDRPGRTAYHCAIHRFMTGEVDVFALALSGPRDPVVVGAPFALRGLAPQSATIVRVERRERDGSFAGVAEVAPSADGRFRVSVPATTSADYRAVTGGLESQLVPVRVSPRVVLSVRRAGRGVSLVGSASPAQPGMPVMLERYSRERFAWFRLTRARFDAHSRVRFLIHPRRKLHLRLIVLRASAGLVRGTSNVVVARPRPR